MFLFFFAHFCLFIFVCGSLITIERCRVRAISAFAYSDANANACDCRREMNCEQGMGHIFYGNQLAEQRLINAFNYIFETLVYWCA